MQLSQQTIELISWRMVAELHRRHPNKFSAIETHPGGGMYDCLSLLSPEGETIVHLNRCGSINLIGGRSSSRQYDGHKVWKLALEPSGLAKILDWFAASLSWQVPEPLPRSTPETLVYRCGSALLGGHFLDRESWELRNGLLDTSGYGGGFISDWFDKFPSAECPRPATTSGSGVDTDLYRFWFLTCNRVPQLCLESTGFAHFRDSTPPLNLMEAYRQNHSSIDALVGKLKQKAMC